MNCIHYHIDSNNKITSLDGGWDRFAEENQASTLNSSDVLNRYLLDYVTGWECRHLYEAIFKQVREKGKFIEFPFRCDGPDTRRYMTMRIRPLPNSEIELVSCMLKEEKRAPVRLLDMQESRSDKLEKICSWCKKIEVAENQWVEVEEAIRVLDLFNSEEMPQLTHGMCPECYEMINNKY